MGTTHTHSQIHTVELAYIRTHDDTPTHTYTQMPVCGGLEFTRLLRSEAGPNSDTAEKATLLISPVYKGIHAHTLTNTHR